MTPFEYIAAGTAIASAAAGAATSSVSAAQASSNAHAQAQAAQNQAEIARQQAETDLKVGASQEGTQFQKNAQVEGTQQAAISQSGIGVSSVSAQDVMRQTAINDALDALEIRYQSQLNAHGDTAVARGTRGVVLRERLREECSNQRLSRRWLGAARRWNQLRDGWLRADSVAAALHTVRTN